jgi:hypothetical protein
MRIAEPCGPSNAPLGSAAGSTGGQLSRLAQGCQWAPCAHPGRPPALAAGGHSRGRRAQVPVPRNLARSHGTAASNLPSLRPLLRSQYPGLWRAGHLPPGPPASRAPAPGPVCTPVREGRLCNTGRPAFKFRRVGRGRGRRALPVGCSVGARETWSTESGWTQGRPALQATQPEQAVHAPSRGHVRRHVVVFPSLAA